MSRNSRDRIQRLAKLPRSDIFNKTARIIALWGG